MKQHILTLLIAAGCACAHAAENITIKATQKKVDQTKGAEQDLPRGKSRSVEKRVIYKFEFQRLSTQGPGEFSVEWMVLIEKAEGRTQPATMGQKAVEISFGQSASIETEPFLLLGREWRGGPNPGTVEDTIAGYGVRVLAQDGEIVAEKYDPASAKSRIDWKLLQAPAPRPGQLMRQKDRMRPMAPVQLPDSPEQ